jgi:sugar/nucleoside kinase (ribokinase family)
LKRGAGGAAVEREGTRSEFRAAPAEVVDTTGAGDAFAAGFLVGGIELALETAARAVSSLGATP